MRRSRPVHYALAALVTATLTWPSAQASHSQHSYEFRAPYTTLLHSGCQTTNPLVAPFHSCTSHWDPATGDMDFQIGTRMSGNGTRLVVGLYPEFKRDTQTVVRANFRVHSANQGGDHAWVSVCIGRGWNDVEKVPEAYSCERSIEVEGTTSSWTDVDYTVSRLFSFVTGDVASVMIIVHATSGLIGFEAHSSFDATLTSITLDPPPPHGQLVRNA